MVLQQVVQKQTFKVCFQGAQIELMCFLPCKNRNYCRDLYPLNTTVAKVKEGSETLTYFKEEKKKDNLPFKPTPQLQYQNVVFQLNSWKKISWKKVLNKHDHSLGQIDSQSKAGVSKAGFSSHSMAQN